MEDVQVLRVPKLVHTFIVGALTTTDYYGDDSTYRKGETKIFCQMDFTSGYHRALMGAIARIFTAFICWCGLFEWLRVPMGLEGAPSYFQKGHGHNRSSGPDLDAWGRAVL